MKRTHLPIVFNTFSVSLLFSCLLALMFVDSGAKQILTMIIAIRIERRSSLAGGDDVYEGTVNRKHEWESTTKKASNRSWDKVYLTLRQGDLAVYKVMML